MKRSMGKRLTAWLLSLALAAALLPGLALPALAAEPQVLTELRLTGMDSVPVVAWGKATQPTIRLEDHWDAFFVQPGKWYRVCDKANLGCGPTWAATARIASSRAPSITTALR